MWVAMIYKAFAESSYDPKPLFGFPKQGHSPVGTYFTCVKLGDDSLGLFVALRTFKRWKLKLVCVKLRAYKFVVSFVL